MAANAQFSYQDIAFTEDLCFRNEKQVKLHEKIRSFLQRSKIFGVHKIMIAERDLSKKITLFLPLLEENFINVDLKDLLAFNKPEINENIGLIIKRLERGDKCFATLNDQGNLYSLSWISFKWGKKESIKLDLKENEALLLESFTFSEYRNRGSQSFNIGVRLKILKEFGFKKAYVIYSKNNSYSKKALMKNGFTDSKLIFYVTILGVRFQISRDLLAIGLRNYVVIN